MNDRINADYDQIYEIRLAKIEDIPSIMQFIDENWRKNHIMAVDRKLFEYEYVHDEEVDFVLAIDKANNSLEGIFGFLRCSQQRTGDIWGSMWKVKEKPNVKKLLGIELAKRVYTLTGCRSHVGNGANPETTIPLRRIFFHEKTARMKQYYILNQNIKEYSIPVINEPWIPQKVEGLPNYQVKEIYTYTELRNIINNTLFDNIPHKDMWYVKHRYFDHPVYKYRIFGILGCERKCGAIFVARIVNKDNAKVARIVDYIGDHKLLRGVFDWIQKWISDENFEYVDFFEFGIQDELMESAGFRNREDFDNIIPNYFEPFVRENIDIWVHYKEEGTTFFKADGDQDRPNLVIK